MFKSYHAIVIFVLIALLGFSAPSLAEDEVEQSKQNNENICALVLQHHKEDTLDEIKVHIDRTNLENTTLVDFDNDGIDEELKYVSGRSMLHLSEVINGERHGFPSSVSEATTTLQYVSIVQISNKYYILNETHTGPYELSKVAEIPKKDFEKRQIENNLKQPIYDIETICNYHNN